MARCAAIKDDGTQCEAPPLQGRAFCVFHCEDADAIAARKSGSSRGGRNAHPRGVSGLTVDTSSPEGILESLRALGQAVADGSVDRGTANSLSYLLSTATAAMKAVSHERRLRKLEIAAGLRDREDE